MQTLYLVWHNLNQTTSHLFFVKNGSQWENSTRILFCKNLPAKYHVEPILHCKGPPLSP